MTSPSSADELKLHLGDNGEGEDCGDRLMAFGGPAAIGGKPTIVGTFIRRCLQCFLLSYTISGAVLGAVEACFINPIPGETTPLIFKAFKLMITRSVLVG